MGAEQDAQGFVHLDLKALENRLHILFAQHIPLFNSLHIIFFFPTTSRTSCASVLFEKQFWWPFAGQMCVHWLCYFSVCCLLLFISECSLVRFTSSKYIEFEYNDQAKLIWVMFFLLSPALCFCWLLSCWSSQHTLAQNPECNNLEGARKHHHHSVCYMIVVSKVSKKSSIFIMPAFNSCNIRRVSHKVVGALHFILLYS